jgi:hypothetical protein
VQVIYGAHFSGPPTFSAGPESLEVRLFSWEEIPWEEIAFPTVRWALDAWHRLGATPMVIALGRPATNPSSDPRGTARIERAAEERPI